MEGEDENERSSCSSDGVKILSGTKRKNVDSEEEERLAARRAANRRSALKCRQQQKKRVEDLRKTIADISKDSSDLRSNNNEMRAKLDSVLAENQSLRKQQISYQVNAPVGGEIGTQPVVSQTAGAAPSSILSNMGTMNLETSTNPDPSLAARLEMSAGSIPIQMQVATGSLNELVSQGTLGSAGVVATQQAFFLNPSNADIRTQLLLHHLRELGAQGHPGQSPPVQSGLLNSANQSTSGQLLLQQHPSIVLLRDGTAARTDSVRVVVSNNLENQQELQHQRGSSSRPPGT